MAGVVVKRAVAAAPFALGAVGLVLVLGWSWWQAIAFSVVVAVAYLLGYYTYQSR